MDFVGVKIYLSSTKIIERTYCIKEQILYKRLSINLVQKNLLQKYS